MTKRVIGAAAAAGALFAAGCSGRNAANEANFKAAINEGVKTQKACLSLDGPIANLSQGIPVLPAQNHASDQQIIAQKPLLKALDHVGLVTLQVVYRQQPGLPMFGSYKAPYITVGVTDKGKPYFQNRSDTGPALCFGRFVVDSIDRFSQPASAMGHMVSQVKYTGHLEDLPDWTHAPELTAQSDWLRKITSPQKYSDKTVLILTNKGWEDQRVAGF
ncbi:hypothetical protein [Paraburkholderia elongata]|uniref:Lipoprotein n=1 Tax=Paraburkholderia elongata TaxID=2675747 RepID=A0A972SI43_9BURK|nr:hypothetical protein [Paraburkholderia elongata]NPT54205.1 hypothetical protein [Paraburkholderia elongata]